MHPQSSMLCIEDQSKYRLNGHLSIGLMGRVHKTAYTYNPFAKGLVFYALHRRLVYMVWAEPIQPTI
jgi:hypothetical protein